MRCGAGVCGFSHRSLCFPDYEVLIRRNAARRQEKVEDRTRRGRGPYDKWIPGSKGLAPIK